MEKLIKIQNELKAPKSQYNSFGKYNYRSCEDIIEAVKPICLKYNATIILSDELILIGERYYIKATASIYDNEKNTLIAQTNAYAREDLEKKGMDGSQITGTASSYARKYALNGLLQIDDTKDSDTDEYNKIQNKASNNNKNEENDYRKLLSNKLSKLGLDKREYCKNNGLNASSTQEDFKREYEKLCKM